MQNFKIWMFKLVKKMLNIQKTEKYLFWYLESS